MASPVPDSYSGASGGVIAAGRYRLPAWRRSMSIGSWAEISSANTLSAIDPKDDPLVNPNYPSAAPWNLRASGGVNIPTINGVLIPWCGLTLVEKSNRCEMHTGPAGGHADNGNNGDFKLDLWRDAPLWSMVCPPSGALPLIAGGLPIGSTPQGNSFLLDDGKENTSVYADGRVRSTHSYGKWVYDPDLDKIILCHIGGSFTSVVGGPKNTWTMDIDTGEYINLPTAETKTFGGLSTTRATYDTLRKRVLWMGSGTAKLNYLDKTNPSAMTWQSPGGGINTTNDNAITYIAEHDVIFYACDYIASTRFAIVDPATGVVSYPSLTGVTMPAWGGAHGHDWVPGVGIVIEIAKTLYALAPTGNPKTDPWNATIYKETDASIPTDTGSGLLGAGLYTKFRYSPKLKGIVRVANATTKPWFFPTGTP